MLSRSDFASAEPVTATPNATTTIKRYGVLHAFPSLRAAPTAPDALR